MRFREILNLDQTEWLRVIGEGGKNIAKIVGAHRDVLIMRHGRASSSLFIIEISSFSKKKLRNCKKHIYKFASRQRGPTKKVNLVSVHKCRTQKI